MKLIGGTASANIAKQLSQNLHIPKVETTIERFPDGELYIRIQEDITGEHLILVQTTYPDPNIIELFLLLDAIKEAQAKEVTVIIPYFGYARQDKKFKDGEPISAKALAKLISINADNVVTVDPHKESILDFFDVPAKSCSAIPVLANYLKGKHIDFILAPDKGALDRAKKTAEILNCDVDYLEKTRLNGSTIQITPKHLDVKNKHVAIIDDIISTGGTIASSIKELKKQNATKVFAACTHGIFAGNAIDKLLSAGCDEIIATDTIMSKFSKVSIAPILSQQFSAREFNVTR